MKAAVILSGCGYLDGAEIRESVLTLLYADQYGLQTQCFAPDIPQHHVVNHLTAQEADEPRNVLHESARIARGEVLPLSKLTPEEFDALLIPGGFGVAKNLSNLAFSGKDARVLPDFAAAIVGFHEAEKPIGAVCISPVVVALSLPNHAIRLTIGEDEKMAEIITATGNTHEVCATDKAVCDTKHKIATASAYMRDAPLAEVAKGIELVVKAVVHMA